jgi:hypothetical protein
VVKVAVIKRVKGVGSVKRQRRSIKDNEEVPGKTAFYVLTD